MSSFAGRGVVITGSTGMAASTARAVAAEGGSVIVVSRTAAHAETLAIEIGAAGWEAADLTVERDVDRAFSAAREHLGRIDAVYGVAGISGRHLGDGPLHEATLDGWETVLRTNATSQFLVARAGLRAMLDQDRDPDGLRGALLLMSSTLARHPSATHFGTHAYAASKGAIEALVRAAAATYGPHGIRVNAIAPSLVATPMSARAQTDPDILDYLARKQPLAAGPIEADAITPVALHLLGRGARMVTGQVVDVDAGWSVSEG